MRQRPRTFADLIHYQRRHPEWVKGVLDAASIADDYAASSSHPYLIGDCILGKLNLLSKRQMRKNKRRRT